MICKILFCIYMQLVFESRQASSRQIEVAGLSSVSLTFRMLWPRVLSINRSLYRMCFCLPGTCVTLVGGYWFFMMMMQYLMVKYLFVYKIDDSGKVMMNILCNNEASRVCRILWKELGVLWEYKKRLPGSIGRHSTFDRHSWFVLERLLLMGLYCCYSLFYIWIIACLRTIRLWVIVCYFV